MVKHIIFITFVYFCIYFLIYLLAKASMAVFANKPRQGSWWSYENIGASFDITLIIFR